jgi:hypothetical protein
MSKWLLDTNVLSELSRVTPNAGVVEFFSGQPLESFYVSVVTLAELRFGIEAVAEAAARRCNCGSPSACGRCLSGGCSAWTRTSCSSGGS